MWDTLYNHLICCGTPCIISKKYVEEQQKAPFIKVKVENKIHSQINDLKNRDHKGR